MCEIPIIVLGVGTSENSDTFLFRSILNITRISQNGVQSFVSFLQFDDGFVGFSVGGVDYMFRVKIINICSKANVNCLF